MSWQMTIWLRDDKEMNYGRHRYFDSAAELFKRLFQNPEFTLSLYCVLIEGPNVKYVLELRQLQRGVDVKWHERITDWQKFAEDWLN